MASMWYFVRRRALKPRSEFTVTLDEHLVWMKQQHEAGKIVMSGPTPDRQYGQYLIRAETREEADAIAASDPYTVAGCTTFEIIEWEVHQIMGIGPFTAAGLGASPRH
ncbi:MAG TPA: YciI family protein [Chloroflexota bacterium]|nr:YciI family protein [Chloroflexota bacterium]